MGEGSPDHKALVRVLLGNQPTEGAKPDPCPHHIHHLVELDSQGIRSVADDVEEEGTDAILLGGRAFYISFPSVACPAFPKDVTRECVCVEKYGFTHC